MPKLKTVLLLASAGAMLASCGGNGVFNRERPDEFAVQRQAPLVVPPDFSLTPPEPGAPRPSEGTAASFGSFVWRPATAQRNRAQHAGPRGPRRTRHPQPSG